MTAAIAVSIHLHDAAITVANRPGNGLGGPYSTIAIGQDVDLFVTTAAQCDALIAAACEAKSHLAPARLDGSIPDPDGPACVCEGDRYDRYCPLHGTTERVATTGERL